MQDDAPRLFTRRLELIAATPALARLDSDGTRDNSYAAFAAALQATVPPAWPPPMFANDQASLPRRLAADATLIGWTVWYAVQQESPTLVGTLGFLGKPDGDGAVDIGHSMLAQFQRRGYATEAMGALIDWAFAQDDVRTIRARVLATDEQALRVLERSGLSFIGEGGNPRMLRFELRRPA
ncbi:MAG TPA: GNAT family N-acetyltransferase [Polyangia bacterium]|nr:GNAT family N-acetyltransferase [Polyangia bacterium]